MPLDIFGQPFELPDVSGMFYPVRCTHCRKVYDAGKVEVTARYADCSVWTSPCCGVSVDDRDWPLKSRPDIVRLDSLGREVLR